MALAVIGAGFGRTGTLSLKAALEQLGFGPCHHMAEIFANLDQLPQWQQAAAGRPANWDAVLAGYRATVGWPSAFFWHELAETYPEAKVLLTTRDPDAWYRSFSNTILALVGAIDRVKNPHIRATIEMCGRLAGARVFDGRADDPGYAKHVFRAHEATVRQAIASERLLVFDVREGWAPLCGFLGVPIPTGPFPRLNDTAQFGALIDGRL